MWRRKTGAKGVPPPFNNSRKNEKREEGVDGAGERLQHEPTHRDRTEERLLKEEIKRLQQQINELKSHEKSRLREMTSIKDGHKAQLEEVKKAAKRETFALINELKSKDRKMEKIQKELGDVTTKYDKCFASVQAGESRRPSSKPPAPKPNEAGKLFSDVSGRTTNRNVVEVPSSKGLVAESDMGIVLEREGSFQKDGSKIPTKLPSLEKIKPDEPLNGCNDVLSKVFGLETLYAVLSEEHLGLQLALQDTHRKLKAEQKKRKELETELSARDVQNNPINVALAERIQKLEESESKLRQENIELREENDLLEFRLLEMDEGGGTPVKRTVSRGSDTKCDFTEMDDVSDSGVMSLPTSEDELQDLRVDYSSNRDVKGKLLSMCQSAENVADRICLQQALALLRHYEARIDSNYNVMRMEQEAQPSPTSPIDTPDSSGPSSLEIKSPGRIVATVLPFTDIGADQREKENIPLKKFLRDTDCLQESGIFEDSELFDWTTRGTQTEANASEPSGDLTQEIRKLTQIRERIEEKGSSNKLVLGPNGDYTPTLKELLFYRERLKEVESRLSIYETSGEVQHKQIQEKLQREIFLAAQVQHLEDRIEKLEEDNRLLEEERCELEEIENDTRLRCQKLETKLSTLGEKKNSLKAQVEQLTKELETMERYWRQEEERKAQAIEKASRMEALVEDYEKKNHELEEKEMEVRYRLQMLENTMPALMMWNMWRMMCAIQQGVAVSSASMISQAGTSQTTGNCAKAATREEELTCRLRKMEAQLSSETRKLEESRNNEETLRLRIRDLEKVLLNQENVDAQPTDRFPDREADMFEKLSRMAKERIEMDKRIKDLELKEKLYQETLQQADTMFAEMEGGYSKQLKEREEELSVKESLLAESENKLRKIMETSDSAGTAHDRALALDLEVTKLKERLAKRDQERETLEKEEKRLFAELQDCLLEIERLQSSVVNPLKSELEEQKKTAKRLEQEVVQITEEKLLEEQSLQTEVSSLKKQINRLTRELLENEVTIGELREEVQTLELAIGEIKEEALVTKENYEQEKITLEAQLEARDKEIESLKTLPNSTLKSLKEEMEELFGSDMIDEEIAHAKGYYRKGLLLKPCNPSSVWKMESDESDNIFKVLKKPEVESDCSSLSAVKCLPEELLTRSAQELQALLCEISRSDTIVDKVATKEHLDRSSLVDPALAKCDIAQKAVAGVNGHDIRGTFDNLSKAYAHSKTCPKCGDTLGYFLEEIIKSLGVKLPKAAQGGGPTNTDIREYDGEASPLRTSEAGPGTIKWDPTDNKAGYYLKPTVSALALTVEQLQEKCRLKDHIIQMMADELKMLSRCANWSGNDMLDRIAEHTQATIDFDRRSLCSYLHSEPVNSLQTEEETTEGRPDLPATNPLGLTVLRQVGPDSLLIAWSSPPPELKVASFEVFVNGMFLQRIRSPGRTKALIHPIDLSNKVFVTLNALTFSGETCNGATINYP